MKSSMAFIQSIRCIEIEILRRYIQVWVHVSSDAWHTNFSVTLAYYFAAYTEVYTKYPQCLETWQILVWKTKKHYKISLPRLCSLLKCIMVFVCRFFTSFLCFQCLHFAATYAESIHTTMTKIFGKHSDTIRHIVTAYKHYLIFFKYIFFFKIATLIRKIKY